MNHHLTTALSARLAAALVGLVPRRPQAFAELRTLYADDMVFRDPIQEVHGLEAFIAMNERLVRRMRSLEWTIATAVGNEDLVVLEWTMKGATRLGPSVHVDGMTRARARDGKVISHRDYWDLAELAASALPRGPRLLRTLLSPLA